MNAKDAHIIDAVNLAFLQSAERKPLCRYCRVPCDPRSREYRAVKLCDACYSDLGPPAVIRKPLLTKEAPKCPQN